MPGGLLYIGKIASALLCGALLIVLAARVLLTEANRRILVKYGLRI
jgi:hypothetical protein